MANGKQGPKHRAQESAWAGDLPILLLLSALVADCVSGGAGVYSRGREM